MEEQYASGWRVEHRCVDCKNELLDNQRLYAMCCPYCGRLAYGSILDTTRHAYRLMALKTESPKLWWQFWKKLLPQYKRVYKEN